MVGKETNIITLRRSKSRVTELLRNWGPTLSLHHTWEYLNILLLRR